MSSTAVLHASRLMQLDDGHEFAADFEIHRSVGACLTISDDFGNAVEINGLDNIQALIRTAQAAELRANSVASIRQAA